ncbi:MAG: metal-sensing transcriptional repressor [Candidatus Gastranaerophilaceae bacterium]
MHADKEKITRLLKTVRGQIDGLIKMVEDDRYCIDISTQILASQSILRKVNGEILKGHFTHCIKQAIENGDKDNADKKTTELVVLLDKLLK